MLGQRSNRRPAHAGIHYPPTCSCTDCMLGHSAALAVNSCGATAGRPTATAAPITPLAAPSRISRRAVSRASCRLGAAGRKARAALSSGVLVKLQVGVQDERGGVSEAPQLGRKVKFAIDACRRTGMQACRPLLPSCSRPLLTSRGTTGSTPADGQPAPAQTAVLRCSVGGMGCKRA